MSDCAALDAKLSIILSEIQALKSSLEQTNIDLSKYALKSDLENLEVEVDVTQAIKTALNL